MNKFIFALLALPAFVAAACPDWVGKAESYPVGAVVAYKGGTYKLVRAEDNGWIAPTDAWFWQPTTSTCDGGTSGTNSGSSSGSGTSDAAVAVLQQMLAELVAVKSSNAQILAALQAQGAVSTSFIDSRDGRTYPMVRIGSTVWMAKDLLFAAEPATCTETTCMYDWNQANQVCPEGWHLPSKAQLDELKEIGGDHGSQLRASDASWIVPGTNQLGFSARGNQHGASGSQTSSYAVRYATYWSGSQAETDDTKAHYLVISTGRMIDRTTTPFTVTDKGSVRVQDYLKSETMSVRCVKR